MNKSKRPTLIELLAVMGAIVAPVCHKNHQPSPQMYYRHRADSGAMAMILRVGITKYSIGSQLQ